MHHLLQHQETSVLYTRCICVLRIIINTNGDYSLYSINELVFITEVVCVYCAV